MEKKSLKGRLDYVSMIIPLLGVVLLCVLFMLMPAKSSYIIQMIRGFLGNDCGIYYALLVVEDDFDIRELLQNFLQEAGYEVATANDGVEALSLFSGQRYDLIILDILLPKIDGYGVCELIRKQSDVPIIMLTALSGEEDQIRGLDLQVDDYITKPFSMPILLRKIAAVLRRSKRGEDEKPQIITYGNLLLNCDSYAATVDGSDFELTQKEF